MCRPTPSLTWREPVTTEGGRGHDTALHRLSHRRAGGTFAGDAAAVIADLVPPSGAMFCEPLNLIAWRNALQR